MDDQWINNDLVSDTPELIQNIELCPKHNEPYTTICKCECLYCDSCEYLHDDTTFNIEDWKKQILVKIDKHTSKLINKINGLKCVYLMALMFMLRMIKHFAGRLDLVI